MIAVVIVFVLVSAGYAWAFQPGVAQTEFLLRFAAPHALLTLYALAELHRDGTLLERMKPRWGDLSIGALVALLLLVASWLARSVLVPAGSERQAWLFRVYAQLGDPELIQRSVALSGLLFGIAIAEEIVWRGLVAARLGDRFGPRRGWLLAALLYSLSSLPTVFTLRDPVAGPNPLLVLATLGCGIVWTFLALRMGRLVPAIFSHMAFTYFSVVQFRWF